MINLGITLLRRRLTVGDADNQSPAAAISAPAAASTVYAGDDLVISGTASDADGTVRYVDVYLGPPASGGTLLGRATGTASWSYTCALSAARVGAQTIYARAVDNAGAVTVSSGVAVTVSSAVAWLNSLDAANQQWLIWTGDGSATYQTADAGNGEAGTQSEAAIDLSATGSVINQTTDADQPTLTLVGADYCWRFDKDDGSTGDAFSIPDATVSAATAATLVLAGAVTERGGNRDVFSFATTNFAVRYTATTIRVLVGGTANYCEYANTSVANQVVVIRFDGSATGNTNRLRMWIDGVEQTASANAGTVPAVIPTLALGTTFGRGSGGANPVDLDLYLAGFWRSALATGTIEGALSKGVGALVSWARGVKYTFTTDALDMETNAEGWRRDPITNDGTTQYVSWWGHADQQLWLAKRTLGSRSWTTQDTGLAGTPTDVHNALSMAVDGSGRLHVAGDVHNNPLKVWNGSAAGDIAMASWPLTAPVVGGNTTLEADSTYPQFVRLTNGDILLFFRAGGGSGDGQTTLYKWVDASDDWVEVHEALIQDSTASAYLFDPAIDSQGRVHISWCWRETTDPITNHDLCYAYTDDGGTTWRKTDGSAYTLPITQSNAEEAWNIAQSVGLLNSQGMCTDSNDRPMICGYWDVNGDGKSQYSVVYWNGSAWAISTIGGETGNYVAANPDTDYYELSTPWIGHKDGRTFVVFRSDARGLGPWVARSDSATLASWTVTPMTHEDLANWAPAVDHKRWSDAGVLSLYYQRTNGGTGIARSASVYEWRPML